MIAVPREVILSQSPWRQTPSYVGEVALPVALAVLVAPEVDRHRRHRLGDHELADLIDQRPSGRVPGLDRGAERPRLQLAQIHRQRRHAADERRAHVGAARGREQPCVGAELVVDPPKAFGRQRRARRADGVQSTQVTARARFDLGLHAGRDERRARAEARHRGIGGEIPQRAHVRIPGVTVEQHDRRLREQHPDEEVPHHPAGRREPEDPVSGLGVEVQVRLLQVLEQDPALTVDDRLRQPGRARAVEHPQRMVEGQRGKRQLPRAEEPVLPARLLEVAELHDALERRDRVGDPLDHRPAVEVLATVAVAVDREQHLRLDLREAIDHAARAELGRCRGPHGADRCAREQRRNRLGDVRQVRDNAVAGLHSGRPQPRGDRGGVRAQLAPRPFAQGTRLRCEPQRDRVLVLAAEDVLGVAHRR